LQSGSAPIARRLDAGQPNLNAIHRSHGAAIDRRLYLRLTEGCRIARRTLGGHRYRSE